MEVEREVEREVDMESDEEFETEFEFDVLVVVPLERESDEDWE